MEKTLSKTALFDRRQVLTAAGALVVAGVGLRAGVALASVEETEAKIKELTGGASLSEGRITLSLPQIAENGNTVPISVKVDSPMTAADHVKAVHILADGNPAPDVASFHLTPQSGMAEMSIRMRLAKTQNIVAVAQMSDGSIYTAKQEIKVTIGGCGG